MLKAANLQSGVNSLTVNIADVEQGLRDNPWVLSVAVKRRLPDAFEIRIRNASAFGCSKTASCTMRTTGQIIAPVNVGNFLSLPTLEILPGGEELLPQMDELSRAFQAAHLPVNMASVSLFRVSAAKGFEVFIENRNLVLCIAAEDWDANLRRLSLVLSDLARRGELKTAREVWAADGNVWVVEPENV
ncbi:MAG: cell division protein FtsQ/DivIB [Bilophila wadsworthia]